MLLDLKNGEPVSNALFDTILPEKVRQFSRMHWTPVEVAIRAAELLAPDPRARVLDVGSGAGKFCMIGALTTEGTFTGVERRSSLVEVAQKTVEALGVPRVSFTHENMADLDWSHYDSFYLFNPFYEHIKPMSRIDQHVLLGEAHFMQYVKIVEGKLARLRLGARVVTYHGFGGFFPPNFRRVIKEPQGNDFLELWVSGLDERIQSAGITPSLVETRHRG